MCGVWAWTHTVTLQLDELGSVRMCVGCGCFHQYVEMHSCVECIPPHKQTTYTHSWLAIHIYMQEYESHCPKQSSGENTAWN